MKNGVIDKRILNDDTIIFIDEVQECKEILTVIKYLVNYGKYRYVRSDRYGFYDSGGYRSTMGKRM